MKIRENSILQLLAPFFITVLLFFNLRNVIKDNSVLYALLKVSPITSLYWLTKQRQKQISDQPETYCLLKYLSIGLIFSGIGDILLIWPATFLHGIAAFAITHIMYINYFDIKPRTDILGVFLFIINSFVFLNISSLLNGTLMIAVLIYSNLLTGMLWRSVDQCVHCKGPKKYWSALGAIGGPLFCFSDLMIAVTMFLHPIPHSEVLIMSTYYFGQFGIVVSCLKF